MKSFQGDFKQKTTLSLSRIRASTRLAGRRAGSAFSRFAGRKGSTARLRHQTLLFLRWMAVTGQVAAVLVVHFGLGHDVPLLACAIPILASAWLNVFLQFRFPPNHRLNDRGAAFYMSFDIIQLFTLLYFTGGVLNPFSFLFLAPVTIAAASLTRGSVIRIVTLALGCVAILSFMGLHWPLPWPEEYGFSIPRRYELGMGVALVIGIVFSAVFTWKVSAESGRMSDALAATETVLSREQRLSAVGALAAAAAHELGTPLATITVVAREFEREVSKGGNLKEYAEDIALLKSQADRCRDILNRLTLEAQQGTAHQNTITLRDLLEEIAEPHRIFDVKIRVLIRDEGATRSSLSDEARQGPDIYRKPEIVHGLGNIVENAVDFAENEVVIEATVNPGVIRVRVLDDGPGFPKDLLDRLGEPFISTRPVPENAEEDHPEDDHGMGLGFFIAKTLLERSGGRLVAGNRPAQESAESGKSKSPGAVVSVTWPRRMLEAIPNQDLNRTPA